MSDFDYNHNNLYKNLSDTNQATSLFQTIKPQATSKF